MRSLPLASACLACLVAATPASAQFLGWSGGFGPGFGGGFSPYQPNVRSGNLAGWGPGLYGPYGAPPAIYGPYNYGYSYGYNYGDPFGYGYADALRAQGEYNRNSADAAVVSEEARRRALDNKARETQYLEERAKVYRLAQAEKYAGEKAAREQWMKNREPATPPRPSALQLDQNTGRIFWPEVLLLDDYAPWRQRLDELFAARADKTARGRSALEIRQVSKALLQELKADVRRLPANDYLEARRFVESLSWESQFAAGQ